MTAAVHTTGINVASVVLIISGIVLPMIGTVFTAVKYFSARQDKRQAALEHLVAEKVEDLSVALSKPIKRLRKEMRQIKARQKAMETKP